MFRRLGKMVFAVYERESDTASRFWRFDIETFITIVDSDWIWNTYLLKKIV